ncbi:MAG: helix-turn-helix domain-containing protein [Roseburia hominis]
MSTETLNIICTLLDCQPGDILEYIPDTSPNTETVEAFAEIATGNGTHFKGNTKNLFQNLQESED